MYPKRRTKKKSDLPLSSVYDAPLAIAEAKFKDLQALKQFCSPINRDFYDNLPSAVDNDVNADDLF